jgi:hypothetical protein
MSITATTSPQPGGPAGETHASATLRVVDPNQLPDKDGKTNNVATEWKLTPNGQPIQVGSQVVPPPPHDPNNDEGIGSVFWRGLKDGGTSPVSFLCWAFGQRDAALNDQTLTPPQQQGNWNKGTPWDDALDSVPQVAEGKAITRGIAAVGDWLQGKTPDPSEPPTPLTIDGVDKNESKPSVTVVNANHGS